MDIEVVRATIEAKLGRPIKQIFSTFNEVALGERLFSRLRAVDLPVVVREFAISLNRETDFRLCGRVFGRRRAHA